MVCWLLGWKLSMNAFREVGEVGYNCDFPAEFLILVFVEMKRIIVHNWAFLNIAVMLSFTCWIDTISIFIFYFS